MLLKSLEDMQCRCKKTCFTVSQTQNQKQDRILNDILMNIQTVTNDNDRPHFQEEICNYILGRNRSSHLQISTDELPLCHIFLDNF